MRIGCCVDYKSENDLISCKKAGVDYVETGFNSLAGASDRELCHFFEFLSSNRISCECLNCLFPGNRKVVGSKVDYPEIDEFLDKNLERLTPLNFSVLVFGSGSARQIPEGFSHKKAVEQLIKLLSDHLAPAMRKYQIVCAIEPLNKEECNLINTCQDGLALVKAVNLPEIRLLSDFYHMNVNQEKTESLLDCAGAIEHVHIASALNKRAFPRRNDGEDYTGYFHILEKAGYRNQRVSVEGMVINSFEPELKEAIACLRSL